MHYAVKLVCLCILAASMMSMAVRPALAVDVTMDASDCALLQEYFIYTGVTSCSPLPKCTVNPDANIWLFVPDIACTASGRVSSLKLQTRPVLASLVPEELASLRDSWSGLSALQYLDLSGNQIRGTLPSSWSSLKNLQHLTLSENNITGNLPTSWSGMTNLRDLSLSSNKLGGGLPNSWSGLTKLEVLGVSGNKFTGGLPSSWSGMKNLQRMYASNAGLSGGLPSSWSALSELWLLKLEGNRLSGGLPASWGQMKKMNTLVLDDNNLSGGLPAAWGAMTMLTSLSLQNNKLRGPLPAQFSALNQLNSLYLGHNALTGSLPGSWSGMTAINSLNLAGNPLVGTIPPSWALLGSLAFLALQDTDLSGTLPQEWAPYGSMNSVNIAGTRISGPIPPRFMVGDGFMSTMPVLTIGIDSQLCGPAPTNLYLSVRGTNSYIPKLPSCQPAGKKLVSVDGRCGPIVKTSCPGGQGCSLLGWCGKTEEHRNVFKGCQPSWGTCTGTRKAGSVSKDGKCGATAGRKTCPVGLCCSKTGVCGTGNASCTPAAGCQAAYGMCYRTGNPFTVSIMAAGGALGSPPVMIQRNNESDSNLPSSRCGNFFYGSPCVDHKVATTGTTLAAIAAMYGTTPHQLQLDNMLHVGVLVAFKAGDILAVRPEGGRAGPRWSATGKARSGPLDARYPRPCSTLSTPEDQATCFCGYHPEGTFVWPFAPSCGRLVHCSTGAAPSFTTCASGQVADETDVFNGRARCIPRPAGFVCADGCSSPQCFCAEYLLPAGLHHNPFDSTRTTGLQCTTTRQGWYGGQASCGAAFFNPNTKTCTTVPQTSVRYRKGYSGCDGLPDPTMKPLSSSTPRPKSAVPTPVYIRPCTSKSCCSKYNAAALTACVPCSKPGCVNGNVNSFLRLAATKATTKGLLCDVWGNCPVWFNINCAWKKPS